MATDATLIDAYRAKIDELVTAVEASDWDTAYIKLISAKGLRAKIVTSVLGNQGSIVKRSDDQLAEMSTLIDQAEARQNARDDDRRFIQTQTGFGGRCDS